MLDRTQDDLVDSAGPATVAVTCGNSLKFATCKNLYSWCCIYRETYITMPQIDEVQKAVCFVETMQNVIQNVGHFLAEL